MMLKAKDAQYGVGRTKNVGTWWKWKIDPYTIDAVLIYAQAGHGRRASLYTDYTFAVWDADEDGERKLVPFAKAYSGLTDAEIAVVDSAIRKTTVEKFGPVRSVRPTMVFEIGFEGIALSSRHKAGIAVRFPRILRKRDDKTIEDADTLDTLKGLLAGGRRMSKSQATQAVDAWFAARGWKVFPFQRAVWRAAIAGQSGLLHANTGSGKTYAVWFAALQRPRRKASGLRVLWITPMRALAADTQRALEESAAALAPDWTIGARTGDTSSAERARQARKLPTTLITTPESLSLLLSHAAAKEQFANLDMIIIDEWHELMGSKRGVQVQLALARLRHWNPQLVVWALSATMGNLAQAREVLLGEGKGVLVEGDLRKQIVVDSLVPANVSRFPWGGHLGIQMLMPVIDEIEQFNATLVFTNTRSQSELWYQNILEARPDWAGLIALHHGSLDREVRDWVEMGLKKGELKAVICTASLDLGVDFLPVERVLQIGSAKGIARLLQRAGRSGHAPGRVSRVTLVPTNSLELLEAAGAKQAVISRRIEARLVPNKPFDVLVQHLVTVALGGGFRPEQLLAEVRTAWSYRHLTDEEWQWALDFVARGGQSLTVYPEYQRVLPDEEGVYRVPNVALGRRHRMGIGTIVSDASVQVKYMTGGRIGSVEESFVGRLKAGDHFLFGGKILEFVRLHEMTAFVQARHRQARRRVALAGRQDAAVVRTGARRARAAAPGLRGPVHRPRDAGAAPADRDPAALVGAAHHRHAAWSRA